MRAGLCFCYLCLCCANKQSVCPQERHSASRSLQSILRFINHERGNLCEALSPGRHFQQLGHAGSHHHRAICATRAHMSAASAGESVAAGEAAAGEPSAAELALQGLPKAATECWRPTTDDVDRISWGKPAIKKSTGSRGVPHRLNDEERVLYDMARRKGFVEIGGSGWRKQRRGAPLVNSYRNWCDARAVPVVYLYKGSQGIDEVQLDLSPLRIPNEFHALALKCAGAAPGAVLEAYEADGAIAESEEDRQQQQLQGGGVIGSPAAMDSQLVAVLTEAYVTEPIHRVPMYSVCWSLERSEAKDLCKRLAAAFECMEEGAKAGGASRTRGMPQVKAGKSRQVQESESVPKILQEGRFVRTWVALQRGGTISSLVRERESARTRARVCACAHHIGGTHPSPIYSMR